MPQLELPSIDGAREGARKALIYMRIYKPIIAAMNERELKEGDYFLRAGALKCFLHAHFMPEARTRRFDDAEQQSFSAPKCYRMPRALQHYHSKITSALLATQWRPPERLCRICIDGAT